MSDIGGWLFIAVLLFATLRIIRYYDENRWWW